MREFKFRAWDHVDKIMFVPETGNNNECFFTGFVHGDVVCLPNQYAEKEDSQYVLMQYTGFKDKTGNDIYEGDILKIYDEKSKCYTGGVVDYKYGAFVILNGSGKVMNCKWTDYQLDLLGNIFENRDSIVGGIILWNTNKRRNK